MRICSCPKRDRQQEESKHQATQKRAQQLAQGIARTNSVFTKPSAKKRKAEVEEFVMVPVRIDTLQPTVSVVKLFLRRYSQVSKLDFDKMNEFAEAAVCARNPDKAHEIKEQRRRLLDMWVESRNVISKLCYSPQFSTQAQQKVFEQANKVIQRLPPTTLKHSDPLTFNQQ